MKKYYVTANIDYNLHLYSDSEFAALLWKDVETDTFESGDDDEEITTLPLKAGDKLLVESYGFEYVDDELINYLNITQIFGDDNILQTTIDYLAWVPSKILNLKAEKTKIFTVVKCETPYLESNEERK